MRYLHLLPKLVNIEEEMSVWHSLSCTFTTHTQNLQVPKEAIETNNHWRKHMHLRGVLPSMGMVEHYSDAKALVDSLFGSAFVDDAKDEII